MGDPRVPKEEDVVAAEEVGVGEDEGAEAEIGIAGEGGPAVTLGIGLHAVEVEAMVDIAHVAEASLGLTTRMMIGVVDDVEVEEGVQWLGRVLTRDLDLLALDPVHLSHLQRML